MRRALLALAVLLWAPSTASADRSYTTCSSAVDVARISCEEATEVAVTAIDAPDGDDAAALRSIGWTPLSARLRGERAEIVAARDGAIVRYRRPGAVPDILSAIAGRELIFAPTRLVGGRPIPDGTAVCTSGFPVRVGTLARLLSAGHCAADEETGRIVRRFSALRRAPQPGVPLGTVRRSLFVRTSLDSLLLRTVPGRGAAPYVWRGPARPPWAVAGVAQPLAGRRVCMTGRTSGVDRCGTVAGRSGDATEAFLRRLVGARVECTTIRARQGDSGGPVYSAPRADGTTFAMGTSTLVIGPGAKLCFTPIRPVLSAYGASLLTVARDGV